FIDNAGTPLYSTLSPEAEENIKKLAQIFPICEIGDFQIRKLKKSNLLIYKLSPTILLALESYEKEGVIISAAKRLEEKYNELFETPKTPSPSKTPPPPQEVVELSPERVSSLEQVKEVVELSPGQVSVTERVFQTVETKTSDPNSQLEERLNEIRERIAKWPLQKRKEASNEL
ncbi:MAG: hypothetical protein QXV37_00535, partial [Candidatus Jordarchaeaceae archaeon]